MKSGYIPKGEASHILASLQPANRLALEVSLHTGLRIGDVLDLKTNELARRMTIRERKTGKTRRVSLPGELLERLEEQAGKIYVFEHRSNCRRPRTRQAVYKDLRAAAARFKVSTNLCPHSLRKSWAVEEYRRSGGDLKRVQKLMNHSNEAVTMLYALSNLLDSRKKAKK